MNDAQAHGAPLGKLLAVSLAIGIGMKLVLAGAVAVLFGIEVARPLWFPGTGLVFAAIAFPFVRRHYRRR
jgi:hypothetical protein